MNWIQVLLHHVRATFEYGGHIMNQALVTFMKIAITVTVIVASLWNVLVPQMAGIAEDIATYIESNG